MELRKVVIGLDFNEPSLVAARWVADHLAPSAELVLVHTVELTRPPDFLRDVLPPASDLLEAAESDARGPLRELAESIASSRVRTELAVGRPADRIGALAGEVDADLIVVGAFGLRSDGRGGLGSTADQLVRCAPVPVLIGRGLPDRAPERILVPVDESDLVRPVLGWARLLSAIFDADLFVVHTLSYGLYGAYRVVDSAREAERLDAEAQSAAQRWLESQLEASDIDPGGVDLEIAFGQPAYEIVNTADRTGTDLIVMGSRGRGQIGPSALGGVASGVLHGTALPVLVVVDPSCD